MEPRLSVVTLGVTDLPRAIALYEGMGWKPGMVVEEDVAFFELSGVLLGLWMRDKLAADVGAASLPSGPAAVSLAYNTRSPGEVDATLARAEAVGGRIVKLAQRAFYGGWYGYFADPDGHL